MERKKIHKCDVNHTANYFCVDCKRLTCEACVAEKCRSSHSLQLVTTLEEEEKMKYDKLRDTQAIEIQQIGENLTEYLAMFIAKKGKLIHKIEEELRIFCEKLLKGFTDSASEYEQKIREAISRNQTLMNNSEISRCIQICENAQKGQDHEALAWLIENRENEMKLCETPLQFQRNQNLEIIQNYQSHLDEFKEELRLIKQCNSGFTYLKLKNQQFVNGIQSLSDKQELASKALDRQMKINREVRREYEILQDETANLMKVIQSLTSLKRDIVTEKDNLISELDFLRDEFEKLQKSLEFAKESSLSLTTIIREKSKVLKELESSDILSSSSGPVSDSLPDTYNRVDVQQHEVLENSIYYYSLNDKNNSLTVYDLENRKANQYMTPELSLTTMFGATQIRGQIVVSGGLNKKTAEYVATTLKYELIPNEGLSIEPLAEMCCAKSNHKLVTLNSRIIFSIGGKMKGEKYINICEKLDFINNKWTLISRLNELKFNVSATSNPFTFLGAAKTNCSTQSKYFTGFLLGSFSKFPVNKRIGL